MKRFEWSLNYHQYGFSFGNVVWYRSYLHIILCAIYYCGYILLNVVLNYTQLNMFSMWRRKRCKRKLNLISHSISLRCCQRDQALLPKRQIEGQLRPMMCLVSRSQTLCLKSKCIVVPMPCIFIIKLWSMMQYLIIFFRCIFLSKESILISLNIISVYF